MSSSINILPVNYTLQFPSCGGGLSQDVECRLDLIQQVDFIEGVTKVFLEDSLRNVLGDAGRGGFEKLELTTSYYEELDVKSDRRRHRVRRISEAASFQPQQKHQQRKHRQRELDAGGAPMTVRLHYTGVAKFRYTAPSNPQQHIAQIIRFAFIREREKFLEEIRVRSSQALTSNDFMCNLEEVSMGNWSEALDRLSSTQVRNCSANLLKGVADPLAPIGASPFSGGPSADEEEGGMGMVIIASVGGIVVAVAALFVAFMLSRRGGGPESSKKSKKKKKRRGEKKLRKSNESTTQLQTIDVDGDLGGEDEDVEVVAGPYVRQKPVEDDESEILPPSVLKSRGDDFDDFESTGGSTIKPLPSRPDVQRGIERGISGSTSVSDLSWDNRGAGRGDHHYDMESGIPGDSEEVPAVLCVSSDGSKSEDEHRSPSRRRHGDNVSTDSPRSMDTTDKLSELLLMERPVDNRREATPSQQSSSRRIGRGTAPSHRRITSDTSLDGDRSTATMQTNKSHKSYNSHNHHDGDVALDEHGRPQLERRHSASSRNSQTPSRTSQRGRRKRVRVGQSRRLGPGGRRRSFAETGSVDSACFSTGSQGELEPHSQNNYHNGSVGPDGQHGNTKPSESPAASSSDEARGDVRRKDEDTDQEKAKRDGVSSKSLMSNEGGMSSKSLFSAEETVDEERERHYGSKNTVSTASMSHSQYSIPLNADRVPENDELSMSAFSINSKASSRVSHKMKKERKQMEDMALRKIMTTRKVVSDIDGISETSNFRRALGFAGNGGGGGQSSHGGYAPSEGGGSDIAGGAGAGGGSMSNMGPAGIDSSVDSSQLGGPLERAAFERMMYVRTISKRNGPRR